MKPGARVLVSLVPLAVGAAGTLMILYAWQIPPFAGRAVMTEDAYVQGGVTIIAPQVPGYLADVPVVDFERVRQGQLLAKIDDRIYVQKVRQAEANVRSQQSQLSGLAQKKQSAEAKLEGGKAQVASAQTALKTAESNYNRNKSLSQTALVATLALEQSANAFEQARAALAQAVANQKVLEQDIEAIEVSRGGYQAAVDAARAALQLAEIDLANTRILAPSAGRLGQVGARKGAYATPGTQLMALVPDTFWITANFKETQLPGIVLGQQVSFTVDALLQQQFSGHVAGFSPATGSEFSVLRPDNATGNFTKVAQRLPVRISIDPGQANVDKLAPGMSVVVTVPRLASQSRQLQ